MNNLDIISAVRKAEEDIGSVYLVINTRTGKKYVGQTAREVSVRFAEHLSDARSDDDSHLCNGIRKHGADAFAWLVLADGVPLSQLDTVEIFWIRFYDTCHGVGYNETEGGKRPRYSEEACQKIAEARRREIEAGTHHFLSEENRQAASERMCEMNQKRIDDGTHNFCGDTHPLKKPENRQAQRERTRERNRVNNPMQNPETARKCGASRKRNRRLALIDAGQQTFC